jgi:hypothetical protein
MARKVIDEFPDYEINSHGHIYSRMTGRRMRYTPNTHGELTVGMTRDGIQYRRSVKLLVARYFVPGENDIFDTPILLDGDRENLHAENIVWRPRWFAWKYARQFANPQPWYDRGPLLELNHKVLYQNVYTAGVITGSLFADIVGSIGSDYLRVFPGGERYAWYEE